MSSMKNGKTPDAAAARFENIDYFDMLQNLYRLRQRPLSGLPKIEKKNPATCPWTDAAILSFGQAKQNSSSLHRYCVRYWPFRPELPPI